jgi:hypothetical protein
MAIRADAVEQRVSYWRESLVKAPLHISLDSAGNLSLTHSIALHLPYHPSTNDINRLVGLSPDVCNAPR